MPRSVHTPLALNVQQAYIMAMTKLEEWMAENGLGDEELGRIVQVDRATISRIRRGLNKPSWDLAARIKVATSGAITADDFLTEAAE